MITRPIVLLLITAGLATVAVRTVLFPERSTPAEYLVQLQEQASAPEHDPALVVREINRVLSDPRTKAAPEVQADLYWLRSEVNAGARYYDLAIADLEEYARIRGETTITLALRIAEIEWLRGNNEVAWSSARSIIENDPGAFDAWRLLGRLEREFALEKKTAALQAADVLLIRSNLEVTQSLIEELSARDPEDGRRVQLASQLSELFLPSHPDQLAEVIDLTGQAALHNADARTALSRAARGGADDETIANLMRLLLEADQADLAVDLGTAAYPPGSEPPRVFASLLDALLAAGQIDRYADRVRLNPWHPTDSSAELCLNTLQTLFTTGLLEAAKTRTATNGPLRCLRVLNRPDTEASFQFFQGITAFINAAALEGNEARADDQKALYQRSAESLKRFANSKERVDPIPGAGAVAALYRARAWRALGDARSERENLGTALTPPSSLTADEWLAHVSGEDYLRHAELVLQIPQRGSRRPEEDWTRGIARLPQRAYELLDRWNEIGQASLDETGHDFERLFTNMRNAGAVTPAVDVGPWTRWKLAERLVIRRNVRGAIVAARKLIDEYPGFIPAYDMLIEAQLQRGSRVQVVEDILERLAIIGPDEKHREYIREIGITNLEPQQLLRLMVLDPGGSGREVIAPRLLAAGEPQRALIALGAAEDDGTPGVRLLRARTFEELSQPDRALDLYTTLFDDPDYRDVALTAAVRLSRDREDDELYEQMHARVLQRLAEDELPPTRVALALVDQDLAKGQLDRARAMLEQLDARSITRDGEVLWRIAMERLTSGNKIGALEALDRSDAFLDDPRVSVARIVLAIEDRQWSRLPDLVRTLLDEQLDLPPLLGCILVLLEERLDTGLEHAIAGLLENRQSPEWLLVQAAAHTLLEKPFAVPAYFGVGTAESTNRLMLGSESFPRDPRDVLAILLLLELPATDVWLEGALERFDIGSEEVWTSYFRTRARTRASSSKSSLEQWRLLTEESPQFGPAWSRLLEDVYDTTDNPWSVEVLSTRVARRAALGASSGASPIERAMDKASEKYLAGDLKPAFKALEVALEDFEGRAARTRHLAARLSTLIGDYKRADEIVAPLIPDATWAQDGAWIEEYIGWLEEGTALSVPEDRRIDPKKALRRFEALEARFPSDPIFPLARAKANLDKMKNPAQTVGFTIRLLASFRERVKDVSFERLRPGSAYAWGEFLLRISPIDAEEFLRLEVTRAPGQLDLWRLFAESISRQNRLEETQELLQAVVAMSRDALACHALAWELVRAGSPPGQVSAILDLIPKGTDPYGPDRAKFLRALSELRGSRANLDVAERFLNPLWSRRDRIPGVDATLLGRTYATVLVSRGEQEDLDRLPRMLKQLGRAVQGPYDRTLLSTLEALAIARAESGETRMTPAEKNDAARPRGPGASKGEALDGEAGEVKPAEPVDDAKSPSKEPEEGADSAPNAGGKGAGKAGNQARKGQANKPSGKGKARKPREKTQGSTDQSGGKGAAGQAGKKGGEASKLPGGSGDRQRGGVETEDSTAGPDGEVDEERA